MADSIINPYPRLLSDPEALILSAFVSRQAIGQHVSSVQLALEEMTVNPLPSEKDIALSIQSLIEDGLISRQNEPVYSKEGVTKSYFVLISKDRAERLLQYKRHAVRQFMDLIDP